MHLQVIICFALLIWWPDQRPFEAWLRAPGWVWAVAWVQVPLFGALSGAASALARRRLRRGGARAGAGQQLYHRAMIGLRLAAVSCFGGTLFLTEWPECVAAVEAIRAVPGLAGLVTLSPFLGSCAAMFAGFYGIDRAIHQAVLTGRAWDGEVNHPAVWSFGPYLNFNIRHHLLVVAVPMMLVLTAFDLADRYRAELVRWFRFSWAAEAMPGVAAAGVFLIAPLLLRHIWTTSPLPDGPLRRELERICGRIHLRCREILIWHSGGMMVNAAVMGLLPRFRYVMLSDGLLESMTPAQIEAVFGHEAGHIRHRHIQFFLLFGVCSMLLVSAVIEALRLGVEHRMWQMDVLTMQGVGVAVAVVLWGLGFGWISRRFERQADVFGAHCVSPDDVSACKLPCSVHHRETQEDAPTGAVCATAAEVFTSALDKVAVLNGIPTEERSWRHSSIASRIRFLVGLAGDPVRARRFDRTVTRIKRTLLVTALAGTAIACAYIWRHPIYGLDAGTKATATPVSVKHGAVKPMS